MELSRHLLLLLFCTRGVLTHSLALKDEIICPPTDVLNLTLPEGSNFNISALGGDLLSVIRSPIGYTGEHVASLAGRTVTLFSSNFTGRLDPFLTNRSIVIRGLRPGDGGIYTVYNDTTMCVLRTINLTVSTATTTAVPNTTDPKATTTAVYSTNTTDPKETTSIEIGTRNNTRHEETTSIEIGTRNNTRHEGPRGRSRWGLVGVPVLMAVLFLIWKREAIKRWPSTRCGCHRRCQAPPSGAQEEELEMVPFQMDTQQHQGDRAGSSTRSDLGSSTCQEGSQEAVNIMNGETPV